MKNFFKQNRENLLANMLPGEIAVFFSGNAPMSTADSHYKFRPDKNFYYLTGLKREGLKLIITKTLSKEETILLIHKPDYDIEKWIGRFLTNEQATIISGIEKVLYMSDMDRLLDTRISELKYNTVYLDLIYMNKESKQLESFKFSKEIKEKYPSINIRNSHELMAKLRMIKSEYEIKMIRKAIELTKNGLTAVLSQLKPEDYEYEPKAIFSHSIMKAGAEEHAFDTIAASGKNGVILHYIENNQVLEDGNLLLMDLGAQYNQYASDITRTYPINGKYSLRQKEIYDIVLKAHNEVVKIMKPGIHYKELNKKCIEVYEKELMAIGLINDKEEVSKYYYHGVGHFMGLDVHDIGFKDVILEPGMVMTVEPGLYIEEEGIGIRIEDDVLITNGDAELLSVDIIRTTKEIENYTKENSNI